MNKRKWGQSEEGKEGKEDMRGVGEKRWGMSWGKKCRQGRRDGSGDGERSVRRGKGRDTQKHHFSTIFLMFWQHPNFRVTLNECEEIWMHIFLEVTCQILGNCGKIPYSFHFCHHELTRLQRDELRQDVIMSWQLKNSSPLHSQENKPFTQSSGLTHTCWSVLLTFSLKTLNNFRAFEKDFASTGSSLHPFIYFQTRFKMAADRTLSSRSLWRIPDQMRCVVPHGGTRVSTQPNSVAQQNV